MWVRHICPPRYPSRGNRKLVLFRSAPPRPFDDGDIDLISRILMNPTHERLSGLCEIARHLLDPLPRRKRGREGMRAVAAALMRASNRSCFRARDGRVRDAVRRADLANRR